jgi:hypothetical protein
MSEAFERIRDSLTAHGSTITNNRQGQFKATCPHHEDKTPSLSVTDKGDRVLVHCHAHCGADDIMADLGLTLADLFDGEPSKDRALPIRSYLYEDGLGRAWFWKDRYWPKTFICRLPGTDPGDRTGLKGRPPVLYHLPALRRGIAAGKTVWLVDGEKDVETAERHGLVATTTPHGAGSRWHDEYTTALAAASEVVIVVDQDKAKPDGSLGTGQQHAVDARVALRARKVKVRMVAPKIGKDLTDHFNAGFTEADFIPDATAYTRPRGILVSALIGKQFPPVTYAIDHILPPGLAILAGSPKFGKSFCALSMGLGVAAGGRAMDYLECNQGSVLYLAREDSERRIQARVERLYQNSPPEHLDHIEIIPAEQPWVGGPVGLEAMTEWAEQVGNPRLVVLDTWAKVDPVVDDRDRYRTEYALMASYKQWADQHECTVLMIHHLRKAEAGDDDPFNQISGTRGITGAADTLIVMKAKRGSREGVMYVTGRDVAEQELELRKYGPLWACIDQPSPV